MRKQPRAAGGLIGVLTDREREIIQSIVTGVSNKELSRRLGIAKGTAKVHLHNIYEKLGITKRSELMTRMYAVADIAHPVPGCGSGRSLGALFLNDRRAAKKLFAIAVAPQIPICRHHSSGKLSAVRISHNPVVWEPAIAWWTAPPSPYSAAAARSSPIALGSLPNNRCPMFNPLTLR